MLLILIFLVAVQTVLALWSQVGGQSHLDLMAWPWKLVITLTAALLIALIAREANRRRRITRRSLFLCSLLIAVAIAAGVVTFYYHQMEASEEEAEFEQMTSFR